MVQAVLFDLDGTLLNSEPMVIECFKEVFKTFGRIEDFTEDRQLEVFGPPLVEEMAKFFPGSGSGGADCLVQKVSGGVL